MPRLCFFSRHRPGADLPEPEGGRAEKHREFIRAKYVDKRWYATPDDLERDAEREAEREAARARREEERKKEGKATSKKKSSRSAFRALLLVYFYRYASSVCVLCGRCEIGQ